MYALLMGAQDRLVQAIIFPGQGARVAGAVKTGALPLSYGVMRPRQDSNLRPPD
ncbi:hypothetical protein KDA_38890 [Dictyobacter alpinus]|uniref:Uncharacterized protein n=1 Tax=Dictyobacter alpinus TaxID=2014873 RepID=A0A402BAL9_9CHLR|nr:hypothetical protein KDA_38890 [Dictyobacter alpinus]